MGKYIAIIEETVTEEFDIIADTAEDAYEIAKNKYKCGEFVISQGEVQFKQIAICNSNNFETEWVEF